MMTLHGLRDRRLVRLDTGGSLPAASEMLWIDLCSPTHEEEHAVETLLGLQVPTQQEMAEIEESARLYEERGALVMTAVVIDGVTEGRPSRMQVTFVLTPTHLVSVRYSDPVPFRAFEAKYQRQPEAHVSSDRIFISLLESIVERAADVLEIIQADLNEVSTTLFFRDEGGHGTPVAAGQPQSKAATTASDDLQSTIKRLGRKNLMTAILRESLLSLSRIVPYVRQGAEGWLTNGGPSRLKQIDRDLRSLSAYETQLSSEITFLHEATLG